MMEKITGLVAASFTPIGSNDELNLNVIGPYSEYLAAQNISGVFINGSTGDFTNLSTRERNQVVEEWSKHKRKHIPYIVHIGGSSMKEVMAMAAHAQNYGFDAISTLGPYYFKPQTLEDLVEYCVKASSSASELPFYYYHIPQLTGLDFNMVDFCRLAKEAIPMFSGIKYSIPDLIEFRKCQNLNEGRFDILFGQDENLLAAYSLGARGFVGSTYNYLSGVNRRLISALESGDSSLATELQSKAIKIIEILAFYGYHGACKSVMKHLGLDFGISRLPHKPLSAQEEAKLFNELERQGLLSHLNNPNE